MNELDGQTKRTDCIVFNINYCPIVFPPERSILISNIILRLPLPRTPTIDIITPVHRRLCKIITSIIIVVMTFLRSLVSR